MSVKQIMFMGLILASGTLVSLTFGGVWLGTEETDITNALAAFKDVDILGYWSITVPNIDFFIIGARALTQMDFAFFSGEMALLQWFLYMTLGLGVIWGIYMVVISVVQGLFRRT